MKKLTKLLTGYLLFVTMSCSFNDYSGYYPMNFIKVKKEGGNDKIVASSELEVISGWNSTLETPSIAVNKNGKMVIAWTDSKRGNKDIYARRYTSDGFPEGDVFQVNTTNSGDQMLPCVAINDNGEFVVTWTSKGQESDGLGIYARQYASNGAYMGNEFKVNTSVRGDQWISSVALNNKGSFVVVWESFGQDASGYGVVGQKFDNRGNPAGQEFLINNTGYGSQEMPRVALDNTGAFIVVWKSNQAYYQSPDLNSRKNYDIYARKYDTKGLPIANEFIVSTVIGEQNLPSITLNDSGSFVVTWTLKQPNTDGYDVYMRAFIKGSSNNQSIKVSNANRVDKVCRPAVAIDPFDKFSIVWYNDVSNKLFSGIYMKKYNSQLQEEVVETKITSGLLTYLQSDVAVDKNGNYFFVWREY